MQNHPFNYCQSEYIDCNKGDKSLEVHWHRNIPDDKIDQCVSNIRSMLKILPAKILVIDGSDLINYDLELNWKIIESSWKIFHDNGGEKIVILNNMKLPGYLIEEYRHSIKEYGIPIELEFKGKQQINSKI
jgi:hypothetical protein